MKERAALAVEGKYSDGKVEAISQGVEWQTSDQATADVNVRGEVTAQREGKVNITARYAGVTSSALTLSITGDTPVVSPPAVPPQPSKPQPAETETIKDMRRKVLR